MGRLVRLQDIDQFFDVVRVPESAVTAEVLDGVRALDERRELEPMMRELLWDPTETHHGPTEIADILTSKVCVRGNKCFGAFVLKGRGTPKVRPPDIDHQVLRLRQLPDLGLMALVAVGHVQDAVQRDFIQVAMDAKCDYLIVDAVDCARLLIAYEKICPRDGTAFNNDGLCAHGHEQSPGVELTISVRDDLQYEIVELKDVSHAGARRLSAKLIVNRQYSRDVLREILRSATKAVTDSAYCRNDRVAKRWSGHPANVVWLYLATDLQDLRNCNWIVRSEWIDQSLDPRMRPLPLKGSETLDGIAVMWNESYDSMRGFYGQNTAGKGDYLALLEPLLERARTVGMEICSRFDQLDTGTITEDDMIAYMRQVSAEVNAISSDSGNLPFPPSDARDYDSRAQSLFGWLWNMDLYYSERGLETWPEKNRTSMMRSTVQDFRSDLDRLAFEREKLH